MRNTIINQAITGLDDVNISQLFTLINKVKCTACAAGKTTRANSTKIKSQQYNATAIMPAR